MELMKKVKLSLFSWLVLTAVGCTGSSEPETSGASLQNSPNLVLSRVKISNGLYFNFKNYIYDSTGRLTEIRTDLYEIAYPSANPDTTFSGSETEKLVYNAAGQLVSRLLFVSEYQPDSVFSRKDYEYNAENQVSKVIRTSKTNGIKNVSIEQYEYSPNKKLRKKSWINALGKVSEYALFSYPTSSTVKGEFYYTLKGQPKLTTTEIATFDERKCPNPLDRHTEVFMMNLSDLQLAASNLVSVTNKDESGHQQENRFSYVYNQEGYPAQCTEAPGQKEVTFIYK